MMGAMDYANVCPRCHEPLRHPGGAARAVPDRDITICGPCCSDEAEMEARGRAVQKMAEWPVDRSYGPGGGAIIPDPI
jgi:hypothetical protein